VKRVNPVRISLVTPAVLVQLSMARVASALYSSERCDVTTTEACL